METSTRIVLGQTGDYEWNQAFSSGGWFMLRSAPNYTLDNAAGALLSKMDTTQHNRGWDLSHREGHRQRRSGESRTEGPARPKDARSERSRAEAYQGGISVIQRLPI